MTVDGIQVILNKQQREAYDLVTVHCTNNVQTVLKGQFKLIFMIEDDLHMIVFVKPDKMWYTRGLKKRFNERFGVQLPNENLQ